MIFFLLTLVLTPFSTAWAHPEALIEQFRVHPGDDLKWRDPLFDDSAWDSVRVPSALDKRFIGPEGFYWYRGRFLSPNAVSNDLGISLGRIGDIDEVYVNGERIGRTGDFYPNGRGAYHRWRVYRVPERILRHESANVIAVRVQKVFHLQAGIYRGIPEVGLYDKLQARASRDYFFTTELSILFAFFSLVMGFYHLFLYFRIRTKRMNLFYFFFALSSSLFMLSLSLKTTEWISSYSAILRLHALSGIACTSLFIFYAALSALDRLRGLERAILIVNGLFFCVLAFLPGVDRIYRVWTGWYPVAILTIVYLFFMTLRSIRRGRNDLRPFAAGMIVMLLTAFVDVLFGVGLISGVQTSAVGFFALNLGIMFALAHDFTGAYRNIEEKVEARTQDLATANEHLRALDKMKERFFANVSHDFKTPIAVAYANIEQAKGRANGEAAEGLGAAERALNKLQGMVTDVLDGLKAEAGELKLKWMNARPCELLDAWIIPYRPLCEKKGLELILDNRVERAVVVPMDVARMERVLANLVSNAIKFTDTGSVTVRCSTTPKDLLFQIIDTGPGIPETERPKVFDRFYQGFNTALRDHGGSGIGLSFVREVVDLHNGRVWVDGNDGSGSVFNVALPLSQDVEITGEYTADDRDVRSEPLRGSLDVPFPPAEPPSFDPKRANVLVVEDNPEVAQVICNSLRDDFNLFFARHGQDALNLLERVRADGVLTDLMMPVMDGTEFLRRLRQDPKYQGLPVVILSSRGEAEDVVAHLKLGAQDYVSKPFRRDVLLARLRAQIDRRKLFERLLSADKMVTLGLLSAGVSHEIRNPLGVALNAVGVLPDRLKELREALETEKDRSAEERLLVFRELDDRLARPVQLALKGLNRIEKIVESMRGFASGSQTRVEINVSEGIDEALVLVAGKAKKRGAAVEYEKTGEVRILGYPTVNQVLVNLLDNAIDAVPEGTGTVRITLEGRDSVVTVAVADNGTGIAPDVLPHIFDPFMTTKAPDQGTGLGLFIVKRIVELQHGGKIQVQSVVGKGTTFTVDLPLEAPSMDIEGFKSFHGYDIGLT